MAGAHLWRPGIGLVGADEPRYAQVAREMLARRDYITPILWGKPWLEKPALYYWRAMFSFREFGVHDWSARLPSASFAFILVTLIYLHIRRFRRGGQLDAALITASCAGIIALRAEHPRTCSLPRPSASACWAGMPGTKPTASSGSSISTSLSEQRRLPRVRWRPFWRWSSLWSSPPCAESGRYLRRSHLVAWMVLYLAMVLPWFIAVQSATRLSSEFFFWNTTSSASPPTVSSTNRRSGITCPSFCWA